MRNLITVFMLIAMSLTQLCAISSGVPAADARAYIEKYAWLAREESRKSGIPASIYLAQACHESGFGTSELAREALNHFGHKDVDWDGPTYSKKDDDRNANNIIIESRFRMYSSAEESYRMHTDFLRRPPYRDLFKFSKTDYFSWAKGLKAAGYATKADYAEVLIALIQKHHLYEYDIENPVRANIGVAIEDDAYDAPTYSLGNYEKQPYIIENDAVFLSDRDASVQMIVDLLSGKRPDTFNNRGKQLIGPQTVISYPPQTPVPNCPTAIESKMFIAPPEKPVVTQTMDETMEIVEH